MRSLSGVPFERLRVDGGATVNEWLMQFQSDIIGVPVQRPDVTETTAMGAAGLAGIASGVWRDAEEFMSVRKHVTFHPQMNHAERAQLRSGWDRAVRATLNWTNDIGSREGH
jgi:Glycerol kinase